MDGDPRGVDFDSFQKLRSVVDHAMHSHFGSWKFARTERLNLEMHYPVVLLQGDLVEARDRSEACRYVGLTTSSSADPSRRGIGLGTTKST